MPPAPRLAAPRVGPPGAAQHGALYQILYSALRACAVLNTANGPYRRKDRWHWRDSTGTDIAELLPRMASVHTPHTECNATASHRRVGRSGTRTTSMKPILEAREELVLRLRFGRMRTAQSRSQVARLLGVSDRTVGGIERRALRKLRMDALGPVSTGWQGWDEV